MCGIAGYWNFRSGLPARRDVIQAMTRTLIHRGPDEEGYHLDGSLALGMRRLQVVDLAAGQQPMANEDGAVQVVFNGEIYNHALLRGELEGRGHRFRTRSDTEAIVHAYEEWGPSCVERFYGMFGLAVWDARRQTLFLARDRLGIKPVYVYEGTDGVVFGSELKAVLAAPWVPCEWDLEAVDDFMTYEYIPAPRTILRDVRKLPAGTSVLYSRGKGAGQYRRFWQISAGTPPLSVAEAEEGLRHHLQVSVRRRLMADVPLGAFLSGGIDSSIIVGLMKAEVPAGVRTVSMGFADRSYSELGYARQVAERHGTTHREQLVTPDVVDLAAQLADYFDEPFADVSAFPTYLVSRAAREDVTVALSGDGGDELFAGYDHYRAHNWAQRLRWLTGSAAWPLADRVLASLPPRAQKKGAVNKAKRFAEGVRRPADLEQARWWVFWDLAERQGLFETAAVQALADRDCFGYYRERLAEGARQGFAGLQRQLYADVTGYLADDILVKLDRMSMAVSLEARVPFLDHDVVEYAMNIPAEWKLRGGATKWILRRAFAPLLPPAIQRRGKEGFSIPMKNWLRGPLQPLLRALLDPARIRGRGWFRPDAVTAAVEEHLAGRQNHAHRLWCLMSLELSLDNLSRRARERAVAVREIA